MRQFEDCGGPYDLKPENMITCYENEPTTTAEIAIIEFLKRNRERYAHKRLLHVGIGNGKLADELSPELSGYFGVTISIPEKDLFENSHVNNRIPTKVIILNKHDPRMYPLVEGCFDLIVDINLKAFTCCEKHFDEMIDFFVSRLNSGGSIVTTETGLWFGWIGNAKRAGTPGAPVGLETKQFRILGQAGLASLCRRHELTAKSFIPPETDTPYEPNERVWLLTKSSA